MRAAFCVTPSGILSRSLLPLVRTCRQNNARIWGNYPGIFHARASASASSTKSPTVVTTPLYYVNAAPHMGSAYPTIAADALSRFLRLRGDAVYFVTGVDEHGEKIATAAATAGLEPPIFCASVASEFEALWELLDIRFDRFVRTTSPVHRQIVREFMERVWENGDIYKSKYEGLYCTGCEEYKDEKDLKDGDVCPTHIRKCEERKEENYFFALTNYQHKLEQFLEDNPEFVLPENRRNEVLGWVKSGVRDFSVSRAHNPWGIPVPRDESQTIYVWFDALLGYISALLPPDIDENATLEDALSRGWPASVHIIGKDILRFHAVYWPAMLMAAGVEMPQKVFGHGFITKDGLKMGKSLGNTLDPKVLVEKYGSDAVRYYFLKAVDFGRDGDFSETRFVNIVNADLANSLGNLLNRSLNLLRKYCDNTLPFSASEIGTVDCDEDERILRECAANAAVLAKDAFAELKFLAACEAIIDISTKANVYIDTVAPWSAFKSDDPHQIVRAKRCLVNVLEASRVVAVGLSPVTTNMSRKVYTALGIEEEFDQLQWDKDMEWGRLLAGMEFKKPKPVFPRMELPVAVAEPAVV